MTIKKKAATNKLYAAEAAHEKAEKNKLSQPLVEKQDVKKSEKEETSFRCK
mgnify:CR=1 FL=1